MAQAGKENIADGLIANGSFKATTQPLKKSALSPKKKTRSKSIGPGGLGELEAPPLKETAGNRRKVCVAHAIVERNANQVVCFHPRRQVYSSLER
jgi:kinetochore protein Spc7/SPC105